MTGLSEELVERRDEFCRTRGRTIAPGPPGSGLEAVVWPTIEGSILKVHRHEYTFPPELAAYQHLAERCGSRLHGFQIPLLLDYAPELAILELSFVTPPYILDFVCTSVGSRPDSFDLDRIERESQTKFGADWPEVRRLLEALMQIGIYYNDVHSQNIRLR